MTRPRPARLLRRAATFATILLLVEFLDELVFSAREAAWPLVRSDLGLDYAQIGLLLSLPNLIANFIEPAIGILGDVWRRRALVLGGGVVFAAMLALVSVSPTFSVLLLANIGMSPASGAFVSLSQATLMDMDTARHTHNMARWTFAGSLGVVAGSLALGASSALGLGWRPLFAAFALLFAVVLVFAWRAPFPRATHEGEESPGFRAGVRNAAAALRRREVLRWLTLLQFSDLMLDVLLGYLALYFVYVVGVTAEQAALAVTVWTGVGLVGDLLLIPMLERVRGLSYLRVSALIELVGYGTFLLVPDVWAKFALLALMGLFNAGWYSILQGHLYSAMPGQSGSVMAVGNVFGLMGALIPGAVGLAADRFGLQPAMWIMILGPVALLIGLPPREGGAVSQAAGDPAPGQS